MATVTNEAITRRFAAIVDGLFLSNRPRAAEALGMPLEALVAVMRGRVPVGSHIMARLCQLSHCSSRWFTEGDMQGMPISLAVRVRLMLGDDH